MRVGDEVGEKFFPGENSGYIIHVYPELHLGGGGQFGPNLTWIVVLPLPPCTIIIQNSLTIITNY